MDVLTKAVPVRLATVAVRLSMVVMCLLPPTGWLFTRSFLNAIWLSPRNESLFRLASWFSKMMAGPPQVFTLSTVTQLTDLDESDGSTPK